MPDPALPILLGTAVTIGVTHTLIGPDHYVPFIAIARVRGWSIRRALAVTLLCGLGHVLSSVVIGAVGIAAGSALGSLEALESARGNLASWALIGFGCLYGLWGLWRARRGHGHRHLPGGGHVADGDAHSITFWTLFIVFVLGPCEPLIPILMFPATRHDWHGVALVTLAFGIATIGTMALVVLAGLRGLALVRAPALERYAHALAGGIIATSGMAIRLFGI
jgi:sulfite exporter TauE/SafE